MSKNILILGSSGLLGSSLVNFFKKNNINVSCHSRSNNLKLSADLTNKKASLSMLRNSCPDVVINLTGLTDVDYCEKFPQEAYISNVKIIENIKNYFIIDNPNCHLIHISSDHVYNGSGHKKINEINIQNFYAFSKYAGELVALSCGKNVSVLRTNFFGYSLCDKRKSFTDWLYNAAKSKNHINVFNDVLFSPLSMHSLSKYIKLIIDMGPTGLVNVGSNEGMSKADFAYKFVNKLNLDCSFMKRINLSKAEFFKTKRPFDMRMDSTSFEKTFNIELPKLTEEIALATKDYIETS